MIIDGKPIAQKIQNEVRNEVQSLGRKPVLAVVMVGDDPASRIYIARKRKVCQEVGIHSELHEFSSDVQQSKIENFIRNLKADGILVQLPLPPHLNKNDVLNAIPPEKDVDGFHAMNMGLLAQGKSVLKPCTPLGILEILKYHDIQTQGKSVVIINRSNVVGQPLALMLQQEPYNATVTVIHEYTKDPSFYTKNADIVVTAVGKFPYFILSPEAVKEGSVVIDVAINRKNGVIFGDVVDFDTMAEKTSYLTKVPGCCGVLTVAMLMKNTLLAANLIT